MRRSLVLPFVLAALIAAGCIGEGNVFALERGTCFDDPTGTLVEDVPIVDCAQPHDNEVFHLFDIEDGTYPGDTLVTDVANDGCLQLFAIYVGSDYWASSLDFGYLTPTSQSWEAGDREVVCFLYSMDLRPLTGSVRGTAV